MPSNNKTSRASGSKPRATAASSSPKSQPAEGAARAKGQDSPASSVRERTGNGASVATATATVTTTARRSGPPPNRRQSRAWLRAEARRRRNRWITSFFTVVVVGAIVVLLITHWPFVGAASTNKTANSACAPTPTAPVGPVPAQTPDPTPPPVSAKPVSGQQGLQYIDVTVGCGDTAQSGDTITVKYTGWLQSDGKMFDSSLLHGGTFQIPSPLDSSSPQVIQGWNIGLDGMKVGGTRRLIIPPALGYGAAGSPPTIPANATLIFDVTLVSIDQTGG